MQNPDGSFVSRYVPGDGGFDRSWKSRDYPGEAAFGLLALYECDPSPRWLRAASKGIDYLARSRIEQRRVPADHWALLATARLLVYPIDAPEEHHRHAAQICESMLREQQLDLRLPSLHGAFSSDGRTAPTASRLEGLLAALDILPAEMYALRGRIEMAADAGIAFLVRAQLPPQQCPGCMPRALRRLPNDGTLETARFNRRATEVRIDYVQHTLGALSAYADRRGNAPSIRVVD
jgi:hypothetical protein